MFVYIILMRLVCGVFLVLPAEGVSVEDVSRALALDTIIVDRLQNFLKETEEDFQQNQQIHQQHHSLNNDTQVQYVTRYIEEFREVFGGESSRSPEENGEETAADHLKSLMLTRRLAKDWPRLLRLYHNNQRNSSSSWDSVKSDVLEAEKELGVLMEDDDLEMQSNSFARVIDVYKLTPTNLTITTTQQSSLHPSSLSSTNLQVLDAAYVGDAAFNARMYGTATQLFSAAKQIAENNITGKGGEKSLEKSDVIVLQQLQHMMHLAASLHDNRLFTEGYDHQSGIFPRPLLQAATVLTPPSETEEGLPDLLSDRSNVPTSNVTANEDMVRYAHLCRGHSHLSVAEKSKLRCWLETRGSPYLILMPAMVEENSLNPTVLTFHQVLTDNQMRQITSMARPMLEQALLRLGGDMDSSQIFTIRSSYTAWLREETHPVLRQVSSKIAALTGLDVDEKTVASEILQVNLYGAGGHYVPHQDSFTNRDEVEFAEELATGDRIATFMFYMNDVEVGGHTVFPRIGVGVQPTKGSAVFWKNLLPDGSQDTRTLHGACPVLKGIKWVCNKWIRHHPQFLRQPCLPLRQFHERRHSIN